MSAAPVTYADVNRIVLGALSRPGKWYWLTLALLGAGVAAGVACFAYQVKMGLGVAGISHPVGWGVYIATFVFWVGIAHSGTLISAILYLLRAHWRLPIFRSAEAMTVFAVMTAGLFPLIHLGRVWKFYYILPYPNQRHLWPNFNSPLVWDVMAIGTYFLVSSIFLFVGMLPDLAAVRDAATGFRRRVFTLLALGWRGAHSQYHHYGRSYLYFAATATPLIISVASVVSFDFAMSLLPGWHSTIFAPFFVAGAIHSGLAMVITLLIPMRRLLRLEPLVTIDHFENIAKVMLLTTAIVGYAYLVEPFIAWISGDVFEWSMITFRASGPYAPVFWAMTFLNVVVPLTLVWKRARRSLAWLFVMSLAVNAGMWLERVVIVVTATAHDFLPANWGFYLPTWIEIGILQGSLCLFGALFLLFVRHLPPVSIAELKAGIAPESKPKETPPDPARVPVTVPVRLLAGQLSTPGVLGVFASDRAAARAASLLQTDGLQAVEIFTPFESFACREALPSPPSPVRWWALAGGLAGFVLGLALPIWSHSIYGLDVGAKPHPSIPSYLIIAFELTVLLAGIANLAGLAFYSLWRGRRVPAYDPRFSLDCFGVWAPCTAADGARVQALFAASGAKEIHAHAG
jgi:molybdopterin-containing oxidoreductase family membrane subunit